MAQVHSLSFQGNTGTLAEESSAQGYGLVTLQYISPGHLREAKGICDNTYCYVISLQDSEFIQSHACIQPFLHTTMARESHTGPTSHPPPTTWTPNKRGSAPRNTPQFPCFLCDVQFSHMLDLLPRMPFLPSP